MGRFRLSPQARQDIRDIHRYIAPHSAEMADTVRRKLHESCGMLARNPHIGHKRDDLTSWQDILFWPVYSYLIVYKPASKPVDILRILHGARNLRALLR